MKNLNRYIIEKFRISKDIKVKNDTTDIIIKQVKEIISRKSILKSSHFYYDVSPEKDYIYISSVWYEKNEVLHIKKLLEEYLNNKKYNITSCLVTYNENEEMIILHDWEINEN